MNSYLIKNTALQNGGGCHIHLLEEYDFVIKNQNLSFSKNIAKNKGGGIYLYMN